jgi:hypothetical protein
MLRRFVLVLVLMLSPPLAVHAKDPPPQPFVEVPNFTLPAPPADQAQIVFIEPMNKIQAIFPVGIYKVEGDQFTLINVSAWRSKSVITLPPGKHTLASGFGWHYMESHVEAGKRYYVLLRFIYGNGFQLRPLRVSGTSEYRVNGPDFPKWMKATTRFVQKTPEADAYFTSLGERWNNARLKGLENWQAKSAAEVAELTLNVDDAVPF